MKKISFFILSLVFLSHFIPLTGYATPLIDAADKGNIRAVTKICNEGTDVNEPDKDGETALMHAAFWGYAKVVKLLIEKGADVNKQIPYYGFTALMKAAEEGHNEVVKLLIEKGAIIDQKDMAGWTAMAWAAYDEEPKTVKLLIEKGADIDVAIACLERSTVKDTNTAEGLKILYNIKKSASKKQR